MIVLFYIICFLICCIPTVIHILNDRNGDRKKLADILSLTLISLALSTIEYWLFGISFYKSLPLIWAIHFAFFDYLIVVVLKGNNFLRKEPVIHPDSNWYTYMGKSSKVWDKILGKISPKIRFISRAVILAISIAYFIGINPLILLGLSIAFAITISIYLLKKNGGYQVFQKITHWISSTYNSLRIK